MDLDSSQLCGSPSVEGRSWRLSRTTGKAHGSRSPITITARKSNMVDDFDSSTFCSFLSTTLALLDAFYDQFWNENPQHCQNWRPFSHLKNRVCCSWCCLVAKLIVLQ
mmetsp:Transcript_12026/g.17522  ORF Transcript_12026/g.17522 Transcript_12026/m.17522 type:complete len:108 (-) Transcript_12026:221-544(-)|eukprot:10137914-Ditylum_brightwellii.AAC.1